MKTKIRGTTLQVVDVELNKGESVYTEKGGMAWMSENIDMVTNTKGGLMKGLGRMISGESLFMTTYTGTKSTAKITFASEFPGNIIPMDLKEGESIICQRDAFMFAESSVEMKMEFRKKLGAGLFGGEGFFLQRITGPGKAFLEVTGEVTKYTLKKGEILRVDPGHVALFEESIDYDITMVPGFKNILFGGEGLFLANLEGPGNVWLQSMPIINLAKRLKPYIAPPRNN